MSESDITPTSIFGTPPEHPLRGIARAHVPIAVLVILIGWLSWIQWPAEQIIAVLVVLLPPAGGAGARS
jgi:hypothetical protein